jgi:hypothetical protein
MDFALRGHDRYESLKAQRSVSNRVTVLVSTYALQTNLSGKQLGP